MEVELSEDIDGGGWGKWKGCELRAGVNVARAVVNELICVQAVAMRPLDGRNRERAVCLLNLVEIAEVDQLVGWCALISEWQTMACRVEQASRSRCACHDNG